MITFSILLITLLAVAIVTAVIAVAFGAGFIAVFGDLVICLGIIWLLIKLFRRRK